MGISFRATSGFVTDASGDTYSLGEAYPVTRGGYTFGFGTNRTGSARDRASTAERLAGIVFVANGGATDYFRHDVPAPGTYTLRLALGDADNAQAQRAVVRDGVGGTVLATITGATDPAEWRDAAGTVRTPFTVWNSSNTSISVTLTGTALVVELGDTGGSNATTISYIDVVGAGDTTPPTITGPGGATGSTSSVSVAENTTAVHTFTANESVTWSLNGGADVARFSISAGGALAFLAAPDFETPTDADTNNTYIVGVRATDGAGNATTQTCTVTVTDVSEGGGGTAPNITSQPGNQTVTEGATATFSVTATGSGTLTYQWRKNGTNISGATSSSYTTPATVLADNGALFSVVVTGDTAPPATSSNATLTVNAAPSAAGFDFNTAAGLVFGALSGSLTGISREVGVSITTRVHNATTGALITTLPATATNSSGRLPRLTSGSVTAGTTYLLTFVWPDGAVYSITMAAT